MQKIHAHCYLHRPNCLFTIYRRGKADPSRFQIRSFNFKLTFEEHNSDLVDWSTVTCNREIEPEFSNSWQKIALAQFKKSVQMSFESSINEGQICFHPSWNSVANRLCTQKDSFWRWKVATKLRKIYSARRRRQFWFNFFLEKIRDQYSRELPLAAYLCYIFKIRWHGWIMCCCSPMPLDLAVFRSSLSRLPRCWNIIRKSVGRRNHGGNCECLVLVCWSKRKATASIGTVQCLASDDHRSTPLRDVGPQSWWESSNTPLQLTSWRNRFFSCWGMKRNRTSTC